jgi:CheY-like chemotaxis protein
MESPNVRLSPTILIIEHDAHLRELVASALKRDGYNVIEASDPDAATDVVGCGLYQVDILLTDIMLPTMSGDELAREMLEIQPNLKIIFSTASNQSEFGAALRNIPHHACLRKPYGAEALRRAVLTALGAN